MWMDNKRYYTPEQALDPILMGNPATSGRGIKNLINNQIGAAKVDMKV